MIKQKEELDMLTEEATVMEQASWLIKETVVGKVTMM